MPTLDSPLGAARSGVRAMSMAGLTLSMLGGASLHQRWAGPGREAAVLQRWMRVWANALVHLFGIEVSMHGTLPPMAAGARLVVASHRSPIDVLILLRQFGGVVLSRGDLASWPVLGPAARKVETIFVDRTDAVSGVLAIRALRDRLQKGRTVIVFPEGTTPTGDEVLEFQEGAFVAARGLEVEVIPVGLAYEHGSEFWDATFMQHMTRMAQRRVTRVACVIGRPRPLPNQRKGLAASLREEVQALVHEARKQIDARTATD
jgi:1-acyl-sn-glycerol-3-phosphate acyltransferase